MKNQFKTRIALLLGTISMAILLLTGCPDFGVINNSKNNIDSSYVLYHDDGKITIGINGGTVDSVRSTARALTQEQAERLHDYFEVVFYDGTGDSIVRATWRIGDPVTLTGLKALDYGTPDDKIMDDKPLAILFAGTESNKNLLAVGKIVSVTNVNPLTGIPTPTSGAELVNETDSVSTSVTFELAALEAGTGFYVNKDAADDNVGGFPQTVSSLLFGTPTGGTAVTIEQHSFVADSSRFNPPAYILATGSAAITYPATYTFALSATDLDDFKANYAPGMIVYYAKNPSEDKAIKPREPQYQIPNTTPIYTVRNPLMAGLEGRRMNNIENGEAFIPTVELEFDTPATGYGYMAYTFEIPIRAVADNIPGAVTWYIRPGLNNGMYLLDNGAKSYLSRGGAFLLAVGDFPDTVNIDIIVSGP